MVSCSGKSNNSEIPTDCDQIETNCDQIATWCWFGTTWYKMVQNNSNN